MSAINGTYEINGFSFSSTSARAVVVISLLETCLPELYLDHQVVNIEIFKHSIAEAQAVAQIAEAMGNTKDQVFLPVLSDQLKMFGEFDLRQKTAITNALAEIRRA